MRTTQTDKSSIFDTDMLYRQYHSQLLALCRRYLRDPDEARDALQDAFLKAERAISRFEGRCHPSTWLYRIAVNECLSRLESRRRERLHIAEAFDPETVGHSEGNSDILALDILRRQLKDAGGITRQVVELSLIEGLTHREIADTLGVSRVAITRRITRFLNQIRPMLVPDAKGQTNFNALDSSSPLKIKTGKTNRPFSTLPLALAA